MTDLAYSVIVFPDTEEGGYYAIIPDLQGCIGDGATPQEAVSDVISASKCWAEVHQSNGNEMPEPGQSDRAFEAMIKSRDEYIESLESEVADLKKRLRGAERRALSGRAGNFSKVTARGSFQAA